MKNKDRYGGACAEARAGFSLFFLLHLLDIQGEFWLWGPLGGGLRRRTGISRGAGLGRKIGGGEPAKRRRANRRVERGEIALYGQWHAVEATAALRMRAFLSSRSTKYRREPEERRAPPLFGFRSSSPCPSLSPSPSH